MIPTYMEIEGPNEESINKMIDKLNISKDKITALNCNDIYKTIYNINVNAIEDEKFYIDIDEDIEYMRENLCKLIIKYVEKFKGIKTLFEFQYVLYVLIKRIYFHFFI